MSKSFNKRTKRSNTIESGDTEGLYVYDVEKELESMDCSNLDTIRKNIDILEKVKKKAITEKENNKIMMKKLEKQLQKMKNFYNNPKLSRMNIIQFRKAVREQKLKQRKYNEQYKKLVDLDKLWNFKLGEYNFNLKNQQDNFELCLAKERFQKKRLKEFANEFGIKTTKKTFKKLRSDILKYLKKEKNNLKKYKK